MGSMERDGGIVEVAGGIVVAAGGIVTNGSNACGGTLVVGSGARGGPAVNASGARGGFGKGGAGNAGWRPERRAGRVGMGNGTGDGGARRIAGAFSSASCWAASVGNVVGNVGTPLTDDPTHGSIVPLTSTNTS